MDAPFKCHAFGRNGLQSNACVQRAVCTSRGPERWPLCPQRPPTHTHNLPADVNIHTNADPAGLIRGQLVETTITPDVPSSGASAAPLARGLLALMAMAAAALLA